MMAQQISDNRVLLQQIKERIEEGLPVYAECGGLMFLVKHILHQGQAYPMVGIFDCDVEMKPKPQGWDIPFCAFYLVIRFLQRYRYPWA